MVVKGNNTEPCAPPGIPFHGSVCWGTNTIVCWKISEKGIPRDNNTHCNTDIGLPYNEAMVADQMVVGIYYKECQGEVLSKDSSLSTFGKKFDLIQTYGAGKQAQSLLDTSAVAAHHSTTKEKSRPKSRILPPNLNNSWMTAVIGRSRHVTEWTIFRLVGGGIRDHQQIQPTNRRESNPIGCSGCGSRDHGRSTKLSRNENTALAHRCKLDHWS